MTKALFPGSFNPFHNGHLEIAERAHTLFDRVAIAVIGNPQKRSSMLSSAERVYLIERSISHLERIDVMAASKLTVDVATEISADVIVRGLRAISDFEYELQMAQMNRQLSGIETVFIPSGPECSFLSSRLIREVAQFGGDVAPFLPIPFLEAIVGPGSQELERT